MNMTPWQFGLTNRKVHQKAGMPLGSGVLEAMGLTVQDSGRKAVRVLHNGSKAAVLGARRIIGQATLGGSTDGIKMTTNNECHKLVLLVPTAEISLVVRKVPPGTSHTHL